MRARRRPARGTRARPAGRWAPRRERSGPGRAYPTRAAPGRAARRRGGTAGRGPRSSCTARRAPPTPPRAAPAVGAGARRVGVRAGEDHRLDAANGLERLCLGPAARQEVVAEDPETLEAPAP